MNRVFRSDFLGGFSLCGPYYCSGELFVASKIIAAKSFARIYESGRGVMRMSCPGSEVWVSWSRKQSWFVTRWVMPHCMSHPTALDWSDGVFWAAYCMIWAYSSLVTSFFSRSAHTHTHMFAATTVVTVVVGTATPADVDAATAHACYADYWPR